MFSEDDLQIPEALQEKLADYCDRVRAFRDEGPLDPVALMKLEEHFKASHVYHSAGIEGNRLTLQETLLVLREGVDVSDRRLKDTIEVANLGTAFDFLKTISDKRQTVRETDLRELHHLVVGDDPKAGPGQYRRTGVIISGSDHRPPEPLAVPGLMEALVAWINDERGLNPIVVATVGHHRVASIHPFADGNGRVSRLVMNLLLMRAGLPIANIAREERPRYYEALSYADVGLIEPLVEMVHGRSSQLFSEYVRIREETKRMEEWAARWGKQEAQTLLRKETREFELWQTRVRQLFLEFQKAAESLDEQLDRLVIEFYDYTADITLERYGKLKSIGSVERSNAFAITFTDRETGHRERFGFKYFRDWRTWPRDLPIIPLYLMHLRGDPKGYVDVGESRWREHVRLRALYFNDEGELFVRFWNPGGRQECEEKGKTIQQAVQWFFDDVLRNIFGLG